MYKSVGTAIRKLLKEVGLDCGLVQSVFRPCAEQLVRLLDARLEESTTHMRVLDVGCGSGIVARVIAEYTFKSPRAITALHGLDWEDAAIEVATIKTINDPRFRFWQGDACTFERRDEKYDAIIAQHLIQHLEKNDRKRSLSCMSNALKPGGWLILGVWPKLTSQCQAYDFLYKAAGQAKDYIGMDSAELVALVEEEGGFVEITSDDLKYLKFWTKRIKSRSEFLRQYFEGSLQWLGMDEKAWEEKFNNLSQNGELKEMGQEEEGDITFEIKMHVVLAKKRPR